MLQDIKLQAIKLNIFLTVYVFLQIHIKYCYGVIEILYLKWVLFVLSLIPTKTKNLKVITDTTIKQN